MKNAWSPMIYVKFIPGKNAPVEHLFRPNGSGKEILSDRYENISPSHKCSWPMFFTIKKFRAIFDRRTRPQIIKFNSVVISLLIFNDKPNSEGVQEIENCFILGVVNIASITE